MKRYAFCLALISIGTLTLALPAAAGTTNAQARKFCAAQWDGEKKAHTVPRGMSQAKYLKLCVKNYAANGTPAPDQTGAATWPATTPTPPANQSSSGH